MRSLGHHPLRASFGSKGIGLRRVTTTSGFGDIGNVLRLKGHAGRIRTTTTTTKAGNGTKDIGAVRTTTMAAGANMITSGATGITTDVRMRTATSR